MTTLPLLPHERLALQAGRLTAVWRPVEVKILRTAHYVSFDPDDEDDALDLAYLASRCPFGQPDDEVVMLIAEEAIRDGSGGETGETVVGYFRIASIAVRRVAEMSPQEAVEWGCGVGLNAKRNAGDVWYWNYGAAEWAWVVGLVSLEAKE